MKPSEPRQDEPVKDPSVQVRPSRARPEGSRSAQPYIPLPTDPNAKKQKKKRLWLILAALVTVIVIGSAYMGSNKHPSAPSSTVAAAVDDRVLKISSADIDREATETAKALIAAQDVSLGPETAPAAQLQDSHPQIPAKGKNRIVTQGGAAAQASVEKTKLVRTVLRHIQRPTQQALLAGKEAIYRLLLNDNLVEDGDAVILYVNGNSMGQVDLTNKGQTVLVVLPVGALSQMRVLAVTDGGGGVTFGASSSVGDVRSKVMSVGDSDNWTVVPQ